jgi:hypothetical protein
VNIIQHRDRVLDRSLESIREAVPTAGLRQRQRPDPLLAKS